MSAAPEFPPVVVIPDRARAHRPSVRTGRLTVVAPGARPETVRDVPVESISTSWSATSWHRVQERSEPAARVAAAASPRLASSCSPVRLTRRGSVAIAGVVLAAAVALGGAAWASAPAATAGPAVPASVTVQSGDTLWSLALKVAPDRDPRAEMDDLARLNHLAEGSLSPGQVLRTR